MVQSLVNDQRIRGSESTVRVAALQMNPVFGDKSANILTSIRLIEDASGQGAKLVVLPELCNTGYVFNSRDEAFALAEPVPGGETCDAWIKVAQETGLYICAGIAEQSGNMLYNSAVLIGPQGLVGVYRKTHLWNEEKLWFEPGDLGFPVFALPFGKIGIRICYDGLFPEVTRILALKGADIVCDVADWVDFPPVQTPERPYPLYAAQQMSSMNNIHSICASRWGNERGSRFIGSSSIVSPHGFVLAGPADANEDAVVIADINVSLARYRHISEFNGFLQDRRTDLYHAELGYRGTCGANPADKE